MPEPGTKLESVASLEAGGEFQTIAGERFYKIRDVDKLDPFFVSVVSNADHWMFVSSSGGLTAGRQSPKHALFPYVTVDKVHESGLHTGPRTLLRVTDAGLTTLWEPFNREHDGRFTVERNLYKNTAGNKLCFEEVNQDQNLIFRYTWASSDEFGFVRQCEIRNFSRNQVKIELLDGLQNILPAGTPAVTQQNASNLVDAYKWTELDQESGLGIYALYSGISDRAEPAESLRANTIFQLGLSEQAVLLSSLQLNSFRAGEALTTEQNKRGIRGAYFANAGFELAAESKKTWLVVANVEQDQGQVNDALSRLRDKKQLRAEIIQSIDVGTDTLTQIIASADGMQLAAEENVNAHHYANVLFNVLRGGIFDDQYRVSTRDFVKSLRNFNGKVYDRNRKFLQSLPERQTASALLDAVEKLDDRQLQRLCLDYLPLTFGRRHGDPSRPWNHFSIKLKEADGQRRLSYEGNWRDVFQNWEALAIGYPEFAEHFIARFVNASTMDGYNPYRINELGIDWEIEEPDDPWSYIGYWGDHQIIYLQKLLEISERYHPHKLQELMHQALFSYANVPYRIKPFEALLENPKNTVDFDYQLAAEIEQRVAALGADGKLVLDEDGEVYQVNLLEKLLVPLLSKLGNLVVDGGIWLNTQRPEWNDANNALVGYGLSMVTLNYMRRYVCLLQRLLADETGNIELSADVRRWLDGTRAGLRSICALLCGAPVSPKQRYESLRELGETASDYRQRIYRTGCFGNKETLPLSAVNELLDDALQAIDHSIKHSARSDGLYDSYNLLNLQDNELQVDSLYPMLEGQVAALSSGAIGPDAACDLLEALFASDIYRADQDSFMLYPDRQLPGFLQRNCMSEDDVAASPVLQKMLAAGDRRIVYRDTDGCIRFNADFVNVDLLQQRLAELEEQYGEELIAARGSLKKLYERVFNHRAFTGRSGGMFGFEGLGCIYWHMVAKLLLAVQENFFAAEQLGASEATVRRLGELYYRIRAGIGFNKTPAEFGAFPNDPYSHTPAHAGAKQPGMTGQVKEEILTRMGELGLRVRVGEIHFDPKLLRRREFMEPTAALRYLDVDQEWQLLDTPANALAFTCCQVPVLYLLSETERPQIHVDFDDSEQQSLAGGSLPAELSVELFKRSGRIRQLTVTINTEQLFTGQTN